jgi:ABC-type lipoprotein release transport system permease subunit
VIGMRRSSRWRKVFGWIGAGFCALGVAFGVSALATVWFVMDAFAQDARDPYLDLAISDQQRDVMMVALALIVTVAVVNIATGFALLLKRARVTRR